MLTSTSTLGDAVQVSPLLPDRTLPLLIQNHGFLENPSAWLSDRSAELTRLLRDAGAILFRGFGVNDIAGFEQFIQSTGAGEWVDYREPATPRSHVEGHIFTSTEYSAENRIYLHNENSHVSSWSKRLYFYCRKAPEQGGETPLADCRRVFNRLSDDLKQPFLEHGWTYVRSFGFGLGFPWKHVFGANSREDAEQYFRDNLMVPEWLPGDKLKVRYRRWAALAHPDTGEMTWFNHGTFYNTFTLEPALQQAVKFVGADNMPYNTRYGDGREIPRHVWEELDKAYAAETVMFPWQEGDIVMLDNMLVAHGRQPFQGKREVYVGMTDPVRCQDVCDPGLYAPPA